MELRFEEQLQRARTGDDKALEWMVEIAMSHLRGSGKMKVHHPVSQRFSDSDAVQKTLMKVYENFRSFRGQSELEWLKWAETIGTNTIRDETRKQTAGKRDAGKDEEIVDPVMDDKSTPSVVAGKKDLTALLQEAVKELPEKQQQWVELKYRQGLKQHQIAEKMEITIDQVAGLRRRAVQHLEKKLGSHESSWQSLWAKKPR